MIQFTSVSKSFTRKGSLALDDVSFSVAEGEIFGLLGHNGAGKSTALGVLLGLVHPDSGEAAIGGVSVQKHREKALANVGAIFESPRFYEYLSGRANLKVLTSYSGFWDAKLVDETIDWVGLTDALDRKVGTYSHGMRQRLALAQALLPRPKLLMLDEPTNGLDPEGIADLRKRIRMLRDDLGITVLLNSHLLVEVEQLCDRVVILRAGKKVFDGVCTDLAEDGARFTIEVDDWPAAGKILTQQLLAKILGPGQIQLPAGADPADAIEKLVQAGLRVREFRHEKRSLEALYLEVSHGKS